MNFVPAAGVTPDASTSGVPAVASIPVTVTAMNAGRAGGAVTTLSPFSKFTVFTFTKHCAPVRLMVCPRLLVTVNDWANAFQPARCASVSPRHAADCDVSLDLAAI